MTLKVNDQIVAGGATYCRATLYPLDTRCSGCG